MEKAKRSYGKILSFILVLRRIEGQEKSFRKLLGLVLIQKARLVKFEGDLSESKISRRQTVGTDLDILSF